MTKGAELLRSGLKRELARKGWKQKDLADALKMPATSISRMMSEDARDPQLETVIEIATALGLLPWELLKPSEGQLSEAEGKRLAILTTLRGIDDVSLLNGILETIESIAGVAEMKNKRRPPSL